MRKSNMSKADAALLENLLSGDAHDYIVQHPRHIFLLGLAEVYALRLPGYYFVAYNNFPIRYIVVRWGDLDSEDLSQITVHFSDGSTATWESKLFDAYITQFGVAISDDGTKIFAQTYETGLHCLDARSGAQIWRTKSKAGITNIFVNHDTVCCLKRNKALQLLDIHTGEILKEKTPATDWGFYAVDHTRILCKVTARKWEVIDSTTLEALDSFPITDREAVRRYTANPYGMVKP